MTDMPRRFYLQRDVDETGVSGIGPVAHGVAFPDGVVVLRWVGDWPTSVVFHDRGVESVEAIHGHNGATRIVWLDLESPADVERPAMQRLPRDQLDDVQLVPGHHVTNDQFEHVYLPKLIDKARDLQAHADTIGIEDIVRTVAIDAYLITKHPSIAAAWIDDDDPDVRG